MTEANQTSRDKAKKIISLSQKDLLRLLANERGVSKFLEMGEEHSRSIQPEEPHLMSARVFLSYARQDIELVNQLYDTLVADGFTPWMDIKSLLPGEKWKHAIQRAIRKADFFLVCLSRNSVNKRG